MSMYILISIAYEISHISTCQIWRAISLMLVAFLSFCFIALIILVFYLSITFTGVPNDYHSPFEEFFRGIKEKSKARLYVVAQLIRKVLFIGLLVLCTFLNKQTLIFILVTFQVFYLLLLVYLNPFMERKLKLIETINESFFLALLASHFYIRSENDWNTSLTEIYTSVIV